MTPLLIHLPGAPVGKARPRPRARGKGYIVPTSGWEQEAAQRIAWAMRHHGAAFPLDCPVRVELHAIQARPKRLLRRCDPDGRLYAPVRPDIDNVAKSVLDAIEKAGAIVNDTRVVHLDAHSLYAARGESPCVQIRLTLAPAPPAPLLPPEPA